MLNFSLLRFSGKREVRAILRKLNDYKISSIYTLNSTYYILAMHNTLVQTANPVLSASETELYNWAKSEIEQSTDFIIYESRSVYTAGGRQLSSVGGFFITRTFDCLAEVFGILNYTADSFSDGGKYNQLHLAVDRIIQLITSGVEIIDIGAVSTRPGGGTVISSEDEQKLLKPLLKEVKLLKQGHKFRVSIDTYHADTVSWLTNEDIDFINDESGNLAPDLVNECIQSGKYYIAMHSLVLPVQTNNIIDIGLDPVDFLSAWIAGKLSQFNENKIDINKVIFDPGIGFGNNPAQAWYILNNINKLNTGGAELLIGPSRKSFIQHIVSCSSIERDPESAAIAALLAPKIDYLRLHDLTLFKKIYPIMNQLNNYTQTDSSSNKEQAPTPTSSR